MSIPEYPDGERLGLHQTFKACFPMSDPVRIGIIGVGFGQQVHLPAFRADARCQVVALCAQTLERAGGVAQRLGVSEVYGDVREMLASRQVDAVSIAVPPAAQPELVIAAAKVGKHVFCEKPLAVDVPAAARALAAVERAGVAHAMDFMFPEIGAWQRARSVLEAGTLGKLRHAALSWRVETYAFAAGLDSWKRRSRDGGGTLSQFVSHSFFYLEWLLGPVARVAARLTPHGVAGDARADLWLELASGCPVTVSVAADAFLGSGHRLEIYGEQGTLSVGKPHGRLRQRIHFIGWDARESRFLYAVGRTALLPGRADRSRECDRSTVHRCGFVRRVG